MPLDRIAIRPTRPNLFGATSAQADMAALRPLFGNVGIEPAVVVFDFRLAESISGSYMRATILWTLLSGKAYAEGQSAPSATDQWSFRPLPLYPVLIATSAEILGEVDDFLKQRNCACLALPEDDAPPYTHGIVLGGLDGFLMDTLKLLASHGPAAAQSLKELSSENISTGGWSNRLAALYSHRLVTRTREGKSWIYQTLAKEHTLWV